jgi:hypothetical protein
VREAIGKQIDVLQIVEVLKNRLASIEGLGAPGPFGQEGEAVFDFRIETDRKHEKRVAVIYVYSKREFWTLEVGGEESDFGGEKRRESKVLRG